MNLSWFLDFVVYIINGFGSLTLINSVSLLMYMFYIALIVLIITIFKRL